MLNIKQVIQALNKVGENNIAFIRHPDTSELHPLTSVSITEIPNNEGVNQTLCVVFGTSKLVTRTSEVSSNFTLFKEKEDGDKT